MIYPRMSSLAPHHMQASQTTSKPIGMRAHCSLPLFPQLHLKTRVATEVNFHLHFGLCCSSQCPPRDANNCNVRKTLVHSGNHMRQLTVLNQTKCTWAPTKRYTSPAEVVLVGKWVALPGFTEILNACPPAWVWMILTKANMLCKVEVSVDTSACFKYLTGRMSQVEEPTYTVCIPFYSHKYHDLLHMHD